MKKGNTTWSRRERFRDSLEEFCFRPGLFRAKVGKVSKTNFRADGIREDTLELREVRLFKSGLVVADHIWVKLNEIENRDVIDRLVRTPSLAQRTIEFSGTAYRYGEPTKGRGFRCWHGFKYALGNISIKQTSPVVRGIPSVSTAPTYRG